MGFETLTHAARKTAQHRQERRASHTQVRDMVDQMLTEQELDQLELNKEQDRRNFILNGGNPETKREFPTVTAFWNAVTTLEPLSGEESGRATSTDYCYTQKQSAA